MDLSRRDLMTVAGTGGVVGALCLLFPGIAAATPTSDDEFETLASRWVDQLTGRSLIDPGNDLFDAPIAALDEEVTENLSLLNPPGSETVFEDVVYETDGGVSTTMNRLSRIAIAWATPGSTHYQDAGALERTIAGTRDFVEQIYNPSQPEFGNWWGWEIGIPRALSNTMAIVREHLTDEDITAFSASIDYYVPDPWEQFPPERGREPSEGANRVDLCQGVIIRSIVGKDPDRLTHAIDGLSDTWQIVDGGNGFYQDGSFIQHSTIGYTGTYGLVLLSGLSTLFALVAGTSRDITDPTRVNLTDAVDRSFAPLIHEGQMMDSVRGRAISRERERSVDNGNDAIEAILRLARAVDQDTATRWRGMCRAWIEDNDSPTILEDATISRLALVTDLLEADLELVRPSPGPAFFPAMDRMIHRGQGWAACVAMCSDRIAWYECGNGENEHGSQTSQGMTYLYLPQDDTHFDDEFWATCDLQGLPGTTVDTTPLPPQVEGQWGSNTPTASDWAGGTVLGTSALAGQHLVGPGGTGLSARKTWVLLPHAIVALGSDITTATTAEVKTVIEHRNRGARNSGLLLDGHEVGGEPVLSDDSSWAHLDEVAGYVFLDTPDLRAVLSEREGSWERNNNGGGEEPHRRHFATLEAIHSPDRDTYAYLVLPGADETATRAAALDPGVEVVRNDGTAQAVRHGQLLAVNFWQAGDAQNIIAHGPVSTMLRKDRRRLDLSIADPTHSQDSVSLTIHGNPGLRSANSDRVDITPIRGGIEITVDTTGLGGQPVVTTLTP